MKRQSAYLLAAAVLALVANIVMFNSVWSGFTYGMFTGILLGVALIESAIDELDRWEIRKIPRIPFPEPIAVTARVDMELTPNSLHT